MDISAVTEQGNTVQQGTSGNNGQPQGGTEVIQGQPEETLSTQGEPESGQEPSVEPTPEEKLAAVEKDYKALQSEFTKRNETEKGWKDRFQAFGGIDKAHEHLNFLVNDPAFHDYLKSRQSQEYVGGQDISQMDDEQKQAVELVQKIVDQTVASRLENFKRENLDPLANSYHKDSIANTLGEIENDWGDIYRENKDAMAEVVKSLPENVRNNPSKDDLTDLMWSVIRRSGNFEKYAAQFHAQSVKSKKENSTTPPPTTQGFDNLPAPKNIAESFAQAKKKLGITGRIGL
jgi:hypothetical protein